MKRLLTLAACATLAGAATAQTPVQAAAAAPAPTPLQVRGLAASCAGCHGTHGVAQPGMDSLAGANQDEMLKKLLDFKTGRKPATLMHQLTKGYSDAQLTAIAAYYASLKK